MTRKERYFQARSDPNYILGVPRYENTCRDCRSPFKTIYPNQVYCSDICRDRSRKIQSKILMRNLRAKEKQEIEEFKKQL